MSIGAFITSWPYWAFFLFMVAICLVAAKAGIWIATRRARKGIKDPDAAIGTAVGSILGLLAFMLGFNFSITQSRFGDRKELVIKQANSLAACYLRASLIPEKQKLETRKLLREYTDILLKVPDMTGQNPDITRLEDIHALLWDQATSLKQENMDSELRTFYIGALNELTGLIVERATVGLIFKIPDILWTSLLLLAVMGTFMAGFQTGLNGSRSITGIPMLAAAFALVIVLIADMDAKNPSRFEVSQAPLKKVQEMMHRNIP